MNIEDVRIYCLQKRGVTEDAAFGPDMILFRLYNKIFACIDLKRPNLVVLKTSEEEACELREHYKGIQGAWHWNKRFWNEVSLDADVEEQKIRLLLDRSYELVRNSLPQKSLFNFKGLPDNWKHEHYSVLDSAMNVIKSEEMEEIHIPYLLITTDYQTAGRGQGKNSWESEAEKNLLFAFRFYPVRVKAVDQFYLLQCISVALALTLEEYLSKGVKIKWPNDIYCEDKKICGILIEHDLCGDYLQETRCGIGINVNQTDFKSSAPNPVSLFQLLGKEVDRAAVLRDFLKHFQHVYQWLSEELRSKVSLEYFKRLYRLSGWYPYRDAEGDFIAHIYAIDDNGCLKLMDRNKKVRKYAHKEVEFLLTKKEYTPSEEEQQEWLKMMK